MAAKRCVYRVLGWAPDIGYDEGVLVRFGTSGAPWTVRADLLSGRPQVISAGLSDDVEFEEEFLQRHPGRMLALDPTPLSRRVVEELIAVHGAEMVTFVPDALDGCEGEQIYLAEIDPQTGEHLYYYSDESGGPPELENATGRAEGVAPRFEQATVRSRTVADLMSEHELEDLDLLKLDIEGGEYAVIDSVLDAGLAVRQIAVEFHHRFAGIGWGKTGRAISRLREHGYHLAWVSDWGEEFLFVRS
jgi:FkbM family methyltransferase